MVKRIIPLLIISLACSRQPKTLTMFYPGSWRKVSPYHTTIYPESHIKWAMYEPLLWQGKTNFLPGVARYWFNIDDTTVVFELERNVLFHDGEKVSPEDVIFSIKNYIKNNLDEGRSLEIKRMVVRDSSSIKIILKRRNPLLLPLLSDIPIVSKELEGTGPYQLVYVSEDTILLKRFEGYRLHLPFQYIKMIVIVDPDERLKALSKERFGICYRVDLHMERKDLPEGLDMVCSKTMSIRYIAFQDPYKFDNKTRHLIYFVLKQVDFLPYGEKVYQFLPILSPFYSPEIEDSLKKLASLDLKPLKKQVKLNLVLWTTLKDVGELIKNALAPYNINVNLIFTSDIHDWLKKIKTEDAFLMGLLYYSFDVAGNWTTLFGKFVKQDKFMEELKNVNPVSFLQLKAFSDSLQWLLFKEMPIIPLYNRLDKTAYTKSITFTILPEQRIPITSIKLR